MTTDTRPPVCSLGDSTQPWLGPLPTVPRLPGAWVAGLEVRCQFGGAGTLGVQSWDTWGVGGRWDQAHGWDMLSLLPQVSSTGGVTVTGTPIGCVPLPDWPVLPQGAVWSDGGLSSDQGRT